VVFVGTVGAEEYICIANTAASQATTYTYSTTTATATTVVVVGE
jgi:hypothetical protein